MTNKIIAINEMIQTSGDGLWSNVSKLVNVSHVKIEGNELKAYFDKEDWDINELGLIYSDTQFKDELIEWVSFFLGRQVTDFLEYSEQGAQTAEYVHFDFYE
jgi:hypothetical protein